MIEFEYSWYWWNSGWNIQTYQYPMINRPTMVVLSPGACYWRLGPLLNRLTVNFIRRRTVVPFTWWIIHRSISHWKIGDVPLPMFVHRVSKATEEPLSMTNFDQGTQQQQPPHTDPSRKWMSIIAVLALHSLQTHEEQQDSLWRFKTMTISPNNPPLEP